jgi:hypothetical protein
MSRFAEVPLVIPEPARGDLEEMYAFLGAALFVAQGLELEVTNLVAGVRYANGSVLDSSTIFQELESRTFGRLLVDVRKHAEVSQGTEQLLRKALEERNRLVHRFIHEHDEDQYSTAGIMRMIDDLRSIMQVFREADAATNQLSGAIWKQFGLTQSVIDDHVRAQLARVVARDGAG